MADQTDGSIIDGIPTFVDVSKSALMDSIEMTPSTSSNMLIDTPTEGTNDRAFAYGKSEPYYPELAVVPSGVPAGGVASDLGFDTDAAMSDRSRSAVGVPSVIPDGAERPFSLPDDMPAVEENTIDASESAGATRVLRDRAKTRRPLDSDEFVYDAFPRQDSSDDSDTEVISSNAAAALADDDAATTSKPRSATKKSYCICHGPYKKGQFMIGCDSCHGWFHGSCVGISEYVNSVRLSGLLTFVSGCCVCSTVSLVILNSCMQGRSGRF